MFGFKSFVWVAHVLLRANGSTLTLDRSRYLRTKAPIGGTLNVSPDGIAHTRLKLGDIGGIIGCAGVVSPLNELRTGSAHLPRASCRAEQRRLALDSACASMFEGSQCPRGAPSIYPLHRSGMAPQGSEAQVSGDLYRRGPLPSRTWLAQAPGQQRGPQSLDLVGRFQHQAFPGFLGGVAVVKYTEAQGSEQAPLRGLALSWHCVSVSGSHDCTADRCSGVPDHGYQRSHIKQPIGSLGRLRQIHPRSRLASR